MSPKEMTDALKACPLPEGMSFWSPKSTNLNNHDERIVFRVQNSEPAKYIAYLVADKHAKKFSYGFHLPESGIQEFVLSEVVPKFQTHLTEVKADAA